MFKLLDLGTCVFSGSSDDLGETYNMNEDESEKELVREMRSKGKASNCRLRMPSNPFWMSSFNIG